MGHVFLTQLRTRFYINLFGNTNNVHWGKKNYKCTEFVRIKLKKNTNKKQRVSCLIFLNIMCCPLFIS